MIHCEDCKGTNVYTKLWVSSNSEEIQQHMDSDSSNDSWCGTCQDHTQQAWIDPKCDKCGDESNSDPGLQCGRVEPESWEGPCTGTYRVQA